MRDLIPFHLWPFLCLSADRQPALSVCRQSGCPISALHLPLLEPRRTKLFLEFRQTKNPGSRCKNRGRIRKLGRPRYHSTVRANLRAGRLGPILSNHSRLGGVGRHSAHHSYLPNILSGFGSKRLYGLRRLFFPHRLRHSTAGRRSAGRQPLAKELELHRRSHSRLSGQFDLGSRSAAARRRRPRASRAAPAARTSRRRCRGSGRVRPTRCRTPRRYGWRGRR